MEIYQNQSFWFSTKCNYSLGNVNNSLNSDCGDHIDLDFVLQSFEFYELLEAHENLYLYVISAVTGVNIKALADLISSLVHSDGKGVGKEKATKKKKICCF